MQLLLLPVKGKRQGILTVENMSQQAGRCQPAAGYQRGRNLAFLQWYTLPVPFTAAAAVRCLHMLHHLVLRRSIVQFPAQYLAAAGVHGTAAFWTDLLILRQFMNNLLHRQARQIQFPLAPPLPALISDLFQFWLRLFRVSGILKQGSLLQKRLRLFAGSAKTPPPHQPELLGQPLHLPVQSGDLFFPFF